MDSGRCNSMFAFLPHTEVGVQSHTSSPELTLCVGNQLLIGSNILWTRLD